MKLSEVGRRHAQARASRDEGHNDADIAEPVRLSSLEPVPLPGSEIELDQLTFILRSAIFELNQDKGRLAALTTRLSATRPSVGASGKVSKTPR